MQKTFILFSFQEAENASQIRAELLEIDGVACEMMAMSKDVIARLSLRSADCLIFNARDFDAQAFRHFESFRVTGLNIPTIIIASRLSKEIHGRLRKMKNLVCLHRPYNSVTLRHLAEKIIGGKELYHRQHERFDTKQKILVEKITDHVQHSGWMHNMSRGGALLEIAGLVPEEGDIYKIIVLLDQVGKEHVVYGEVMRVVPGAFNNMVTGAGIRYVSPEDLYNEMLKRLK